MQGEDIAEVRGILPSQNVEPLLQPVLDEKFVSFGAKADKFKRRSEDMRHLTEIETAMTAGTFDALPAETKRMHLRFLYELDHKIEGFGYQRDPRITEIRARRNPERDMPIVFGCDPRQIAHSPKEIRPDTKAYVGPLAVTGWIFMKKTSVLPLLPPTCEHVYTRFPEEPVELRTITIGGKTREQLRSDIHAANMRVSDYASDILDRIEVSPASKQEKLVILSVAQLGFPNGATRGATRREIYAAAEELGLAPAPAEVGPHLRLQYTEQPSGGWLVIGMQPITDRHGGPLVFGVGRDGDGLWLFVSDGHPDYRWNGGNRFVFVPRT
jgi:hypothetical protein